MILSDKILGKNPASWGKLLFGIFGLPVIFLILSFLIGTMILILVSLAFPQDQINDIASDQSTPPFIFFEFLLIGGFHIVLYFYLRIFYGRKYRTMVNPLGKNWKWQMAWGALYVIAMMLLSHVVSLAFDLSFNAINYVWRPATWLLWLLPMIVVVFLQTSAEEIFFRGYIQQYLARLVPNRWIYIPLPAMLWASLHYWNFDSDWLAIPVTLSVLVMGLIFGDWADRTGSLIGPMTAHFLNNFMLLMFFGSTLEPSDLNIYQLDLGGLSDEAIGKSMLYSALLTAVVYLLLRKRLFAEPPLRAQ